MKKLSKVRNIIANVQRDKIRTSSDCTDFLFNKTMV